MPGTVSDQEQNLEREILADARHRAERLSQHAKRDAEAFVQEARTFAEQERERLMLAVRQRAEREQTMQEARLEQEVHRLRRGAFQDVLNSVRAEAEKELAALAAGQEGRQVLVRLAVSAIGAMRGESFALALRREDRQRWGAALAEEVRSAVQRQLGRQVSVKIADGEVTASGGLIVRGEGTRELVDQTFEARIGRLWEDIRGHVAGMLDHVWDAINERSD